MNAVGTALLGQHKVKKKKKIGTMLHARDVLLIRKCFMGWRWREIWQEDVLGGRNLCMCDAANREM